MSDSPFTPHITQQPPVATIKIVSEDTESGYVIINEADFDKKTMKKYSEKPEAAAPPAT